MADATANTPNMIAEGGPAGKLILPDQVIKTAEHLYDGAGVWLDPNDSLLLKSATPSGNPLWLPRGVAADEVIGDGKIKAHLYYGPTVRNNSATSGETVPTAMWLGWPLYAKDNLTVSMTNGDGLYPFLGWFGGWTGEATPRPIVWIGSCPFALREILIPVAKGHADLTAAAATQDFTLLTLPGPARVMHPPTIDKLTTAFSGGGTGTGTLAIGADSDPDALGDEKSIFTGGGAGAMTAGVLGYAGALLVAGTVIKAQFATDTTVAAFTAGAVVAHLRLRPGS